MVASRSLFAAPHRLLFLTGAFQLAAVLAWWSAVLLDLLGMGPSLPQPTPAFLLHAPLLLFLVLPPFFFGFLLTVFPRWLGFADSTGSVYLPVAVAFAGSAVVMWSGLFGLVPQGILAAFLLAAAGWLWALACMLRLAIREQTAGRPTTWHAWSILAAITIGLACMVLAGAAIGALDPLAVHIANLIGLDLFVLPVFVTVCHRMIPFFAGNVVKDYARWRPFWSLWGFWGASITGVAGFALSLPMLAAAGKAGCAGMTGLMLWKWWPRGPAPGLLRVLLIGFAWAPAAFALAAWSALFPPGLGRGGIHLLTIGLAASLVIAMVTRVTQGHSGRPLIMPGTARLAFAAVQAAAALRLLAAARGEQPSLLALSAVILTAGILPWVARAIWIYLRPRLDGKPG